MEPENTPQVTETPQPPATQRNNLSLITGIVVLVALLVGGGVYLYEKHQQTLGTQNLQAQLDSLTSQLATKTTPTPVATASTAATPVPTADPTTTWKTYSDTTYKVSFKYPTTWSVPTAQLLTQTADGPWWNQGQSEIDFNEYAHVVSLSSFSTYEAATYTDPTPKANLQILKDIFAARKSTSNTPLWLPPSNAGIIYHGTKHYIESSDGKWRGEYYFAQIGQSYIDATPQPFTDMVMVLTDGQSTVVQLQGRTSGSGTPATSSSSDTCYDSKNAVVTCSIYTPVQNDFTAAYQYFPNTLSTP